MKKIIYLFVVGVLFSACSKGPKVIAADTPKNPGIKNTGIFQQAKNANPIPVETHSSSEQGKNAFHKIIAKESLPSSKYVYVLAQENEKEFWLATSKMEIEIGSSYVYQGGLLKRNFESKEHNRVFEEIYLVSKLMPESHGQADLKTKPEAKEPLKVDTKVAAVEGSMKISDFISKAKSLAGETVQLTGVVTKINSNIMGRNWIHLKDGSNDDYDLVVTSDFQVPVGHEVTLSGLVALERDFGSGYYYEVLVEEAQLVR